MNKRINEIQQSARIIDAIADNLIEDHVDLMLENAALQNKVDLIKASLIASLIERLDEYHPPEHWTDAHIEHENKKGNMMAPVVRRAKDAVQAAIRSRGEK